MKGKILVPVDFSENAAVSYKYAQAAAVQLQHDIILFHSFFDQIYFSDGGFVTGFESGIMLTDEIILDFYKQKELKLNEIVTGMREALKKEGHPEVSVTCQMESGDPEVQILNAIDRIKPQLIIMGSSGMGKKSLFAGSVARRVMDHANSPVIAVPNSDLSQRLSSVAYMTIFEPSDPIAISLIDEALSPLAIHISCVHVCISGDDSEAKAEMSSLSHRQFSIRPDTAISFNLIGSTGTESTLESFLQSHNIDLIAFIPHKRNIFKSLLRHNITRDDLFLTRIPILAIPASS